MEHAKHEEFYGDFVRPAIFIAYPSPYTDLSEPLAHFVRDPDSTRSKMAQQRLINQGRLTSDYRQLYHKKGETVYAMVQEFVDLGPSVFTLNSTDLTSGQKDQLRKFAEAVKSAYREYCYFPDPSMWKPSSGNLRFDKDGQLVLIDTNSLQNNNTSIDNPSMFLNILKRLYENGEESSQQ